MKKHFGIAFIALLCMTGLFADSLIVKEDANLREQPDKTSAVIQVVGKNSVVSGEVSTENENWYKITYEGNEGYVHKSLVEVKGISEETVNDVKYITIFIICLIALIISMKLTILNRLITISLHVGRLIFVIMCMKGSILYSDDGSITVVLVFGAITAFLTLYGIGNSAFDDTRKETGNVLLNPVEGGGYKLCAEITGNSPAKTFVFSILWSVLVGVIVAIVLGVVATDNEKAMYIIVIVLSIIGIVRGIISFIQWILKRFVRF